MSKFILHPERNGVRQLEHVAAPRFLVNIPIADIQAYLSGKAALMIENPIFLDESGSDIQILARLVREAGDFVAEKLKEEQK